jgi:hypothetical protein
MRLDYTFYEEDIEQILKEKVSEMTGIEVEQLEVTSFRDGRVIVGMENTISQRPDEKTTLLTEETGGWWVVLNSRSNLPTTIGLKRVKTDQNFVRTAYWSGDCWEFSSEDSTPFSALGVGVPRAWREME